MLTKEALQERMWGKYPTLRKFLQDKNIPRDYYGISSISDNIFSRTERLIEVTILVKEFLKDKEIKDDIDFQGLMHDLENLTYDLNHFCEFILQDVKKIDELKISLIRKFR